MRKGLRLMTIGIGCFAALPAIPHENWVGRVSSEILSIYNSSHQIEPSSAIPNSRWDNAGRVEIDVRYDCAFPDAVTALKASGLVIENNVMLAVSCTAEGWLDPANIAKLVELSSVKRVNLPHYAMKRSSPVATKPPPSSPLARQKSIKSSSNLSIDQNGVSLMHASQFVAVTGTNGAGVTVGVMSDNVTSLSLIEGRSELPIVTVLPPSPGGAFSSIVGDEGTMMLEEVHAVAPGASLAFCSPGATTVGYQGCLQQLINAGASITVDDIAFPTDLMSSNSEFEQGVQSILSANPNVAFFTVAENYAQSYWEGAYVPTPIASFGSGNSLTCAPNGQIDYYVQSFGGRGAELMTVDVSKAYTFLFQWADPFDANQSNFDLYFLNQLTGAVTCIPTAGLMSTLSNPLLNLEATTYDLVIGTPDASLANKFLKLLLSGDGAAELSVNTTGSVVSSQAFVPGAFIVGAVDAADGVGNTVEPFSGRGPITLVFPSAEKIDAPSFVAPDDVLVDAAGTSFTASPSGLFQGTSAAAPNAAAIAALIRSAFPSLPTSGLRNVLTAGATQLSSPAPDFNFGYGRVDAMGALAQVPAPTISLIPPFTLVGGSASAPADFTVTGTGPLGFHVQSTATELVPAIVGPNTVPGITIEPSTCGTSTFACTIQVTPTLGRTGSASVTVTVSDGAGRMQSVNLTVTVNPPPPPSVSITANATQTATEGAALAPVSFTISGTGPLTVSDYPSRLSAVSISSGCNANASSCTATLGTAASVSEVASVVIEATDSYGQVGAGLATVTIYAPAGKSGGGSLDWIALLVVSFFTSVRLVKQMLQMKAVSMART